MRSARQWVGMLAMATCFLLPSLALADPVIGQVDNFEDGTTQGWLINLLGMGNPPPEALPVNVPTGGPGGLDDHYLQLTSVGGNAAGGRLVALNLDPRWTGDYVGAGIGALTMDVNNVGTVDLALRILFEHVEAAGPTDIAFTTEAVVVPAGSGWVPVTFRVGLDDLTASLGSVENALRNASVIRLFHGLDPGFPGPQIVAQLGVDNIRAVPEPAAMALLLVELVGAQAARRLRGRSPVRT